MYLHPRIRTMTLKARKIISDLFDLFIDEPHLMPERIGIFLKMNLINIQK